MKPKAREGYEKKRKEKYQAIGKAIIIFEGFYTGRSGIAKQGFAQKLPLDVAKYMARCFDYKSLLLEQPTSKS